MLTRVVAVCTSKEKGTKKEAITEGSLEGIDLVSL